MPAPKWKPRDIAKVIDAMLQHVPQDRSQLRRNLQRLKMAVAFTAPESIGQRWHELQYVFNNAVFGAEEWNRDKAPEWAEQAGRILAGEVEIPA
jgi:hypothetical protein